MNTPVSVLSDGTIRDLIKSGRIGLTPYDETMIQPASVDVRLGSSFRVFHNHRVEAIDLLDPPTGLTSEVVMPDGVPFVIHPGEFCLGNTLEWVTVPNDLVARIEGKSSLGRLGLLVHATAGFCDPGFEGNLTLELANLTRVPILLRPGLPIAQLSFMTLDKPALRPYGSPGLGSHYHGQAGATASRYEGSPARTEHTFEQFTAIVGPDVCGCDALEAAGPNGEAWVEVGWVPCPPARCERDDHRDRHEHLRVTA